ncbi:unnamed protein product [Brassica napus]|uniref:(rape) hypothetical protein n=1 Tax=Brassica napus TaxID=3708 RepID=A0A816PC91_BRANA|nr:unnamed protein product [Brassica napus]
MVVAYGELMWECPVVLLTLDQSLWLALVLFLQVLEIRGDKARVIRSNCDLDPRTRPPSLRPVLHDGFSSIESIFEVYVIRSHVQVSHSFRLEKPGDKSRRFFCGKAMFFFSFSSLK